MKIVIHPYKIELRFNVRVMYWLMVIWYFLSLYTIYIYVCASCLCFFALCLTAQMILLDPILPPGLITALMGKKGLHCIGAITTPSHLFIFIAILWRAFKKLEYAYHQEALVQSYMPPSSLDG